MCCELKNDNCKRMINKANHEGSIKKFEAFEKYYEAWAYKIIQFQKNKLRELNFFDLMSSSGLYNYNGKFIEGTALLIFKKALRLANQFPNVTFRLNFNDYNKQYIECIKCNIKENKKIPLNIKIQYFTEDIDELLSSGNTYLNRGNGRYNLFIYDPYDVKFNWDSISNILKNSQTDLLFTHFFPNDIKRNISNVKSEIIISRYEMSYQSKFLDMKNEFKNLADNPRKRSDYFRKLFIKCMKTVNPKVYYSYAPVFNSQKTHVYDIMCTSSSSYGAALLKNEMYKLYKESPNQLALFLVSKDPNSQKEFDFRYNLSVIRELFIEEFSGKRLEKKEFDKMLREHPFIPEGVKREIKKDYKYKCSNGIYIFPKQRS